MGGSSATEYAPRRLSKPRTNTSSSNLLSLSEQFTDIASPLSSSASDYFGENAVVVNSQGECRSRRKSRSKIRAYLYGTNHEVIQTSSDDEDGRGTFNGAARDMRKRLSRTGSSIIRIQSAKASTARLPKSESQESDMEESVIIADQIKERAYYDSLAAQNHVCSPVDEDKHPDSVMAPLRRKSLYTPGLATRNPNDILRKPHQQDITEPQIDRDYYYDPSKPAISPLSQLEALNAGEDGRSTPSNMHYLQLGGLQLGTLRVTNGTASPVPGQRAPDLACRSPTPESRSHDDFYTASEGSVTGGLSTPIPLRSGSPLRFENKNEPSIRTGLGDSQTPRESFPFRQEKPSGAATIAHEYMAELDSSPFSYSETPVPKETVNEGDSLDDEGIVIPQAEGPAADRWRQFIDDAETRHGATVTREDAFRRLNGYTPSISDSKRLSVPSSMASRYSASAEVPKTDSGYSSNASLSANHATLTTQDEQESGSGLELNDSPMRSRYLSGPCEMPQRVSMPGEYLSQPTGPPPREYSFSVIPQHALPTPAPSLAAISSPQNISSIRSLARSSSSNLVRKLQKPRPKSQPPQIDITAVQRIHELSQAVIPRVPSLIATQHAERLRQFPLLEHTFPSSHHTTCEERISPTDPKAMPIRFPSPENAPETPTPSSSTIASRLGGKRRSRSGALSQSRASTAVVEDEQVPSNVVRSPSWSEYGGGRKGKEEKRQAKEERELEKRLVKEEKELEKRLQKEKRDFEKQVKQDEKRTISSRSRSASRTRAKSSERPSTIADFGTVTQCLGGSPYDIATSMFPSASRDGSNWHPHQISTAMPLLKPVVGMDEAVAAESTRARSRARSQSFGRPSMPNDDETSGHQKVTGRRPRPQTMNVDVSPMPALAAVDLRAHDLEWARNRRRSQSFSGPRLPSHSSFNDRGGLPGRSIRSESLIIDAPPVPALPSIQQVKQREAQTIRSRPQSMFVGSYLVPTLTTSQMVDRDKSQVSISPSPSKGAMARPRKTRTNKLVPDLWCHGSLETKAPKAVEQLATVASSSETSSNDEGTSAKSDSPWEAQRRAWSQRRKSAGEALLRNQITEIFDGISPCAPIPMKSNNGPLSTTRALSSEPRDFTRPEQTARPGPTPMASFPNPLASNPYIPTQESLNHNKVHPAGIQERTASYHTAAPQERSRLGPRPLTLPPVPQTEHRFPTPAERRAQTQSYSIPRKRVGSGTSTPTAAFERLTGRYTGGLQYGYEPGCGLGGSAGTRSAKTEASRKSVDVSKAFGLDLSDLPVFVAPTLAG
jgi:hypothetical protein